MVQYASLRAAPTAYIINAGELRFPATQGIGNFRFRPTPVFASGGSFEPQVESETPPAIAQREAPTATVEQRGNIVDVIS
ncbi:MAG: hypothetical protein HOC91_01455 [Nitrospinaceae bacterium]|nr:hypothetical protein [Nitrospinaceae bacterium]MBT3433973.1 hypothetical protein [Nitrospinaceae bacterium]MBT3821817.1 hypothetical protein [Nitrospinaceae bacterium]MBT4093160.1 hypothetical protein [Nitrospinaceae bacterium]MBT4429161.1 hypothetical protein [Nitrospinaceae bacterium]